MNSRAPSAIIRRVRIYCNVLRGERRPEAVREVEAVAAAVLKRAGRLRQAVLRAAFEGRL